MLSTSVALDSQGKGFWNAKKDQLILKACRQEAQRRGRMWNGPWNMSGDSMDTKGLESREEKEAFREREVDVQRWRSEGAEKGHKGKNLCNRNIVNLWLSAPQAKSSLHRVSERTCPPCFQIVCGCSWTVMAELSGCGQSLKCLLSDPLQKDFSCLCSRTMLLKL